MAGCSGVLKAIMLLPSLVAVFYLLTLISLTNCQSLGTLKSMPRPPEMLNEPQQLSIFKIAEDLKLDCLATAEPAPSYYWTYNGKLFDVSGQDNRVTQQPNEGTIVFNSPMKKDEGVYQCFAFNAYGTAASQNTILYGALLDEFPPQVAPDIRSVSVGDPLCLPCIPPKSIPSDPEITWEKYYSYSGYIEPVIFSNRISIDSYGFLYFTTTHKEDQLANNGEYRCSVFNKYERKSVSGNRYRVLVSGDIPLSSPATVFWYSPDIKPVGVRGQKLILQCIFAGEPVSRVWWDKTVGDAPMGPAPRVTTDMFGQQLVFNSIEFSDAGRYECSGSNLITVNAENKAFYLRVESIPFWTERPQNIEAGEGDTVTFVCKADGIPTPKIDWFINGQLLTLAPSNARRYSTGENITYTSVRTDDAQVIQCNASNIYGYIFANAYLNVIRSEPIWKVPPPPQIMFAEGLTKNLTCQTYAGPRAQVSWEKDGIFLTGGRYKVYVDGDLEIQDIVTTDAGNYTCIAKNTIGLLIGTALVTVAQPTLIVQPPVDLMVNKGTEAKFTCTGTTDPGMMNELQIVWMKYDAYINDSQSGRLFQNTRDNSLTITDVNEQDAAIYTCVARTSLDSATARAFLRVRDVPNPPEIIEVRCKNNRTTTNKIAYYAIVYFMAMGSNYAPITKFDIEYATDFEADAWTIIASTDDTNPTEMRLSPYGNFTFRIRAWNFIGISEPSIPSKTGCRTDPDVPTVQPKNVKAEGYESNNMVITWTPILPIDHNGAGFKYELQWNCTEVDCINDPQTRGQATIPDYTVNRLVVTNQPSYHRYSVKVTCRNEVGLSSAPVVPIIGYSGEFKPTLAPTPVTAVAGSITFNSVKLEWPAVANTVANIGGFLVGYVIRYFRPDDGFDRVRYELVQVNDPEKRFTVPSTHSDHPTNTTNRRKRSLGDIGLPEDLTHRVRRDTQIISSNGTRFQVLLTNVPANSNIAVSVAVFNTRYYGPFSPAITIRTQQGPPGPVDYFGVRVRNTNMIKVEWIPPVDPNGDILGYDFAHRELQALNLLDRRWDESVTDPTQRSYNVSGLRPETMYRIYIYAKTIAGRGDENFLDVATTSAGAPEPVTFDVNNITDYTMNVTWVPSTRGNPGSVFYVQYRKTGRTDWEISPTETENLWLVLLNLWAGTSYEVRVVAQNGFSMEAASYSRIYKTSGSTGSLSYVVAEPWFILMFLSAGLLIILLILLVRCRDKWARPMPEPEQEQQQLNVGYQNEPPHYYPGGYNVAYSRSGENLSKPKVPLGSERAYADEPDVAEFYPEKSRDSSSDYHPQNGRAPSDWERQPPYGGEDDYHFTPAYAPHDEPAPVMFMPGSDTGPARAPPPRYNNQSFDSQDYDPDRSNATDV